MKCKIIISRIETIYEIKDAWSQYDMIEMLDRLNFPDAKNADPNELKELLDMAINDFDPSEAAEIILSYKLSNILNARQIHNISHEMLEDKIAEEYPDISLHYPLFNINQLLYKAYNGKFPNTKASKITVQLNLPENEDIQVNKEFILKILSSGLSDQNIILRLFEKQMTENVKFPEAEHIIWILEALPDNHYSIITSDYWLNKEDFKSFEFVASILENQV